MTFFPHEYRIKTPSAPMSQSTAQGGAPPTIVLDSILLPVSKTIDLSVIAGIGVVGTPGVVYERDYFLFHQNESVASQRVFLSTDADTAQTTFTIQMVVKEDGREESLSEQRSYETLPADPDVFAIGLAIDSGAVYLRVRSTYQSTQVYVTIELLTTRAP